MAGVTAEYTGALCGGAEEGSTDWGPSLALWPEDGAERVYVECCNRMARLAETETRWVVSFGGYVTSRLFRCSPAAGCHVNPGYLRTAHLRYYERADE